MTLASFQESLAQDVGMFGFVICFCLILIGKALNKNSRVKDAAKNAATGKVIGLINKWLS